MPVKTDVHVPPPANSHQPGLNRSLLYNGSRFQGHQKSKGNCYDVEVVLQVKLFHTFQFITQMFTKKVLIHSMLMTEEFPTLTTFFDGEIISKRFPFLTRKWDADEDVDKKHWVSLLTYKPFTVN